MIRWPIPLVAAVYLNRARWRTGLCRSARCLRAAWRFLFMIRLIVIRKHEPCRLRAPIRMYSCKCHNVMVRNICINLHDVYPILSPRRAPSPLPRLLCRSTHG